MGVNFPPDIVSLALQSCRYDFQGHICQNQIKVNLYKVQETCTETFGSQVFTGYRNVSSTDTSRYDFQGYIFPHKTNIIGHDVNGMYAVTCGHQFSPGYRNVSIAVACRYDFQDHI